jgi:hypothetical protein
MTDVKNNGKEIESSAFDTEEQKKLNTLDNLIKVRNKTVENSQEPEKKPEDEDAEDFGGLPGFGGIF